MEIMGAMGIMEIDDDGIVDVGGVVGGDGAAAGIVVVKVFQLDREDSGLQLVEAGVATDVVEDIFAGGAVVGDGTDGGGEKVIVGGDGTGVAEGAEVLAGVERVGGGVAEGAGSLGGLRQCRSIANRG